ncbi:GAF domain-containing protein [Microbacterium gorillae]|uniref:GAF domain-containing protein n=1 Tax=Microbacterium gorillae TaxID=1231063 RepID=UPI00058D8287|nr:GAF domain-containing protein [Microbacterium gorillae]
MSSMWSHRRDVSPETSRLLVARAHEEFVGGNPQDRRLADVRALVRDSWGRSLSQQVGAEALPLLALTGEELEEYRRAHPLAGVRDMIRSLLLPGTVEDAGVVVAVGDASGRLLWVDGDRQIRSLTGEMGFVAGADWSEGSVGTSAPGTALALEHSVQIVGAEHFNRFVQPWSCTAAPVRDPETGRIVGVIDVTGGTEVITPQAQLLVDATARAVEGELLVTRLRERQERKRSGRRSTPPTAPARTTLRVLGLERAALDVEGPAGASTVALGQRHAEILLMLTQHRSGLSAERLAELVYGDPAAVDTLRPEMVRLRKALTKAGSAVTLASRPYRLEPGMESDAHRVLSLVDRGAHRVALAAFTGDVLTDSVAPGVEEFRDLVRTTLRDALLAEANADVLLAYADTAVGADDLEVLRLALELLPPRSPKRTALVARIERLG